MPFRFRHRQALREILGDDLFILSPFEQSVGMADITVEGPPRDGRPTVRLGDPDRLEDGLASGELSLPKVWRKASDQIAI